MPTAPLSTRRSVAAADARLGAPTAISRGAQPLELGTSYFPAIDGLRAVAIVSVLTFHTGLYTNGLFGVDAFFVLSGYLITLTMLREYHRTGTVSLATFYIRRTKRLLPLLIVVLLATLGAVIAWGKPYELSRFSEQALASLIYVTNWQQIASGQDYWDGFAAINPLGHMWSLAITEQFYIVWPIVVFGLLALCRVVALRSGGADWRQSRSSAFAVLGLGSFGLVVGWAVPWLVFDGTNPDRVYLGTDTHFVGLIAGVVAASITYLRLHTSARRDSRSTAARSARKGSSRSQRLIWTCVSVAALSGIVVLSVRASSYGEPWLYEWGITLVSILVAITALTLTTPHNLLTRAFSQRALVETGKISYALFLVHLPVYWALSKALPWTTPLDLLIIGVPASLLIASALHHLLGEPLRVRPWGRKGRRVFMIALASAALCTSLLPGLVNSLPRGAGEVKVLTLGDSLANDFASALADHGGGAFSVADAGIPGCGIAGSTGQRTAAGVTQSAPEGCNPWEERWQTQIDAVGADIIVVNIAWDAVTQVFGEHETDLSDPAFEASYRLQLERMAQVLESSGAEAYIANARLHSAVVTPEQARSFNRALNEMLVRHPHLTLLDLDAEFCDADECSTVTADGADRYLDDRVHFSEAGQREVAAWLSASLADSVQRIR